MNACNLWFDQLGPLNWHQCCVQHDIDYGMQIGKVLADAKLGACVNAVLPGMGSIMWLAVTIFGGFWYGAAAARYFAKR